MTAGSVGIVASEGCAPLFVEECDGENMMLDWTGGFHESGHNVFDSTNRLHDAADFVDASIVIAEPLDGCMGVPMDGSAATGAAITGTFADGSMTGKIALIRRGACYFTSKTINAQNAGAVAAVIYNDDRAGLVTMSGPDVGIEIPAIFIDGRVGDAINEAVAADPSITFSLHCGTVTRYTEPLPTDQLIGDPDGTCYYMSPPEQYMSWFDARDYCAAGGGALVSIDSAAELDWVVHHLNNAGHDRVWIGLNDDTTEGTFTWTDGSPMSWTGEAAERPPWFGAEPNGGTGGAPGEADCVRMAGNGDAGWGTVNGIQLGQWGDYGCLSEEHFVCEMPPGTSCAPAPAPTGAISCSGTFSIASDNAYALYVNGNYRGNVNGGRTNIACPDANGFGDPYTGCNWQSVDQHTIRESGPLVLAVDALDGGGTGGWVGTAVVYGVEYPTNSGWRCFHSTTAPDAGWMMADFVDVGWPAAFEYGFNGVAPWGDVNREMGAVDDGGWGMISETSQWIWSEDKDAQDDVYCRLVIPCGGKVLYSEDFEAADALDGWRGKNEAPVPYSGTLEDGGHGGGKALKMNQCASGGDSYSADTFLCSVDSPCLVSFWTKGRPWQGFAEEFAGPHIWTATPQDYHGMHVRTPYDAPDDQDWRLTEYVFPGEGVSDECVNADCGVETTFTYGCGGCDIGRAPMRFMFESFSATGACDSTWVDDITITSLTEEPPPPPAGSCTDGINLDLLDGVVATCPG